MKKLENLHRDACEWIVKAGKIQELIINISKISNALSIYSATYKQMCLFQMRLRLLDNEQRVGTIASGGNTEYNQICNACLQSCQGLQEDEIIVFFDYHPHNGFQYVIRDTKSGVFKYKFKGNLYQNQPDGEGEAIYSNGYRFKGTFEAGLRHGKGQLLDKKGTFLQNGYWYQDAFISEERQIKFYTHLKAAASQQIGSWTTLDNQEYEFCYDPYIQGKNLVAFKVAGESMIPVYNENDIIVCERHFDIQTIVFKKAYVILHHHNFMLKIIKPTRQPHVLLLVSENVTAHPNFKIEVNEQTQIFEVKGICKHLNRID